MTDPPSLPALRTLCVSEEPEPATGALVAPIHASTSYASGEWVSFAAADWEPGGAFFYSRWENPTTRRLEERIAGLEGAAGSVVFASGMAAVSALLLSGRRSGDHVIMGRVGYLGVTELAEGALARLGIGVTRVDLTDLEAVTSALRPATVLVFAETPANPTLRLVDIAALAKVVHAAGAKLAIDSTLATPVSTRPLALGADWALHSLSKYMGGHGDALGGAVVGSDVAELAALRRDAGIHLGATLGPFGAWLVLRGLETLALRVPAHAEMAVAMARALDGHPAVLKVEHPALPGHPQHDLFRRQMRYAPGVVSFWTADATRRARRFRDRLTLVRYAPSFGKTRSVIIRMQGLDLPADPALEGARDPGLFRVSTGLEDPEELVEDLVRALD